MATYEHVSEFVYGGKFRASGPWYNGMFYLFLAGRIANIFWTTIVGKPISDHDGRCDGVRIVHHIDAFDPYFILCLSLGLLPTAYLYVSAGGLLPGKPVPMSAQAGVLLAVLLYLVLWFVDLLCRAPLVERLLHLRRELVTQTISPRDALKRMSDIVPTEKDRHGRIIVPSA